MIFDYTQVDWVFVAVFVPVFYCAFLLPVILKKLKIPNWFSRKSGHIAVNGTLAFLPFFMSNLFDFIITFVILLTIVIITSFIPQIRMMSRVYDGNLREGEKSVSFTISTILSIVTIYVILFVFKDMEYIITAAYLSVAIGDGLGEMVGKPFGKMKYKIFVEKSVEGSIAVFLGIAFSIALTFAIFDLVSLANIWKIIVAAILGTIAEALTYVGLDNSTVPLTVGFSIYLFMMI
ncbi:MAG: hypothetical protein KGD64_02500 [Candidatus Heimdallarchaeota archaeon]|nr:hypothetical protein [Candidatus Heimdallarchaeota archaeon]